MKTTINCFIPFADAAQAEKTIQGLKSSNLVKDIYLLVTEDTEVPLQGCRILHVLKTQFHCRHAHNSCPLRCRLHTVLY